MSKEYEIAFKLGAQLESTFSKSFTTAAKSVEGLGQEMKQLQKKKPPTGGFDKMQQEIKQTEGALSKLGKATKNFGATLGKVAQVSGAFAIVDSATSALSNISGSIGGFQDEMNLLRASTGASKEEMAGLKEATKNLYNQGLGEDWADLSKSMSVAKQVTKQQGAQLESTTKNAVLYRDVFGEDVSESIKAADTMAKNFGITMDQAYNLLAQGAQKGLNKSNELLDTANEYSPYFAKLGFAANDMFDILSSGLEAGAFNLDKVGDGIKEFGIRTKDGSKASMEAYKDIGLNGAKMTAQFAAGGKEAQQAFLTTVKAINEIKDPVKKNAASVALFGTQAEDLEARVIKSYGNVKKQFDMTNNTMGEIADIKFDSVGEGFKRIGRQLLTGFIMPLGDLALPVLQKFSGFIGKAIPVIKSGIAQIGSTVGPIMSKVGGDLLHLFQNGYDGEMKGVTMKYGQMLGLSSTDAAAITGGIAGVFDKLTTIKDNAITGWKSIMPSIKSIFDSVMSVVKQALPVIGKIGLTFMNVAGTILKALQPVVLYIAGKIWPVIAQLFNFIATQVYPKIAGIITAILPQITAVTSKIGEAVTAIFNFVKPIIDALFTAFQIAFPAIKAIVMAAFDAIGGVISGIITTIGGVIDFVTGVFSGNWEKAWTGVRDIFSGIFSSLGSILSAPINAVINLINEAIRKINGVSVEIPDWVPGIGGEKFGVSIPEIKPIGGYAKGGIVSSPEIAWVGEGGDKEVIIPINNSQRSQGLYEAAGRMLGQPNGAGDTSQPSGGGDFVYSPTFVIQGNADQAAIQQMDQQNRRDFSREFNDYKRQRQRVSLA